jgi:hypothetical protein
METADHVQMDMPSLGFLLSGPQSFTQLVGIGIQFNSPWHLFGNLFQTSNDHIIRFDCLPDHIVGGWPRSAGSAAPTPAPAWNPLAGADAQPPYSSGPCAQRYQSSSPWYRRNSAPPPPKPRGGRAGAGGGEERAGRARYPLATCIALFQAEVERKLPPPLIIFLA